MPTALAWRTTDPRTLCSCGSLFLWVVLGRPHPRRRAGGPHRPVRPVPVDGPRQQRQDDREHRDRPEGPTSWRAKRTVTRARSKRIRSTMRASCSLGGSDRDGPLRARLRLRRPLRVQALTAGTGADGGVGRRTGCPRARADPGSGHRVPGTGHRTAPSAATRLLPRMLDRCSPHPRPLLSVLAFETRSPLPAGAEPARTQWICRNSRDPTCTRGRTHGRPTRVSGYRDAVPRSDRPFRPRNTVRAGQCPAVGLARRRRMRSSPPPMPRWARRIIAVLDVHRRSWLSASGAGRATAANSSEPRRRCWNLVDGAPARRRVPRMRARQDRGQHEGGDCRSRSRSVASRCSRVAMGSAVYPWWRTDRAIRSSVGTWCARAPRAARHPVAAGAGGR